MPESFAKPGGSREAPSSSGSFVDIPSATALLVLAVATTLFALLAAYVVFGGGGTSMDFGLTSWLHAHSTPTLTAFFLVVTNAQSTLSLGMVSVVICAYFLARRQYYWVLTFLLTVFGGMLLNVELKHLFMRARPYFPGGVVRITTFSFPSGHTLVATVFYGTLCAFCLTRTRSQRLRVLEIFVSFLIVALVALSRIYLGVHYLTDVLGALAEGCAWLALCFLTVAALHKRVTPRTPAVAGG